MSVYRFRYDQQRVSAFGRCLGGFLIIWFVVITGYSAEADLSSPVKPHISEVDTSSPRATLRSFLAAMNDYRTGIKNNDERLLLRINDAVFCLSLSGIEEERRNFIGRNAARYIKEVIDRIWDGNFAAVPGKGNELRWRLKGTVFTIVQITEGERRGEYLFSRETVLNAENTYRRYSDLPYQAWSGKGAYIKEESQRKAKSDSGELYVKTDNPRQTMRTFMLAMEDYRKGKEDRIADAINCLDLSKTPPLGRNETGRLAAILLKEVIDRIIKIDYSKIPERQPNGDPIVRWRLKNSQNRIVIVLMTEGPRKGEYLFSAATVAGIKEFYNQVKHKPYLPGTGGGANFREPWFQSNVPSWLKTEYILFPTWQWLGLLVVIFAGYLSRHLSTILLKIVDKAARHSKTEWDDRLIAAARAPSGWIVAAIVWYIGISMLRIEGPPHTFMILAVRAAFCVALIWLLYRLSEIFTIFLERFTERTDNDFDNSLVPLVRRALRTFIVVFGVLISMQNLGFNVMSVLAGLGLGGLALALAAQDTCANFFGSLMILIDRPFKIGDVIRIGGDLGVVEQIGFRSTRIRTFEDSLLNVPNSKLANEQIDNLGKRRYRRTMTKLGLTYDTPPEKLEAFAEGLKNILKANPKVRKDYFITAFTEFADFSLNILLMYFVEVDSYEEEMAERHRIFIQALRLAEEIGVSFAFPTQSIFLENMPNPGYTPPPHEVKLEELRRKVAAFAPGGPQAQYSSGLFIPTSQDPDMLRAKEEAAKQQ